MKLSIVIVNWNTEQLLLDCLTSIYDNSPHFTFEVIVVDNASSDQSVVRIQEKFPQTILVKSNVNLGFGAGNNSGIEKCKGEYTLLLNPDTKVIGSTLQVCVDYLDSQPDVAVIGIKQRELSGKLQESCGHFPSLKTVFLQGFLNFLIKNNFSSLAKTIARIIKFEFMPLKSLYPYFNFEMSHNVDWVMGAFMLIRADVLKACGGFDPYFKMYAEEIDLCFRIRAKNWKIQFFPHAEILHYGGASTKNIAVKSDAMRSVAMIRFYMKNNSKCSAYAYRFLLLMHSLIQFTKNSILMLLHPNSTILHDSKHLAALRIRATLNPSYNQLFNQ